ncbi:MAG: ADP-ribosylglycohydrolase family protein [Oscillatoriales cyanobacterium SM2_2_1]|nr:ADP-ribosylglycohydrolase family protein [Oscillatoriales cyanobacterium SM2_2_1]
MSEVETATRSQVLAAFLGFAVADALGVPVEFCSREQLLAEPVGTMRGYGTWNQLPGTWSDDSSLLFCLAESLCTGFDLNRIAQSFLRWRQESHWSARGAVFDIGATTAIALYRLQNGIEPARSGETANGTNGNGSLMRTLPLAWLYPQVPLEILLEYVHQVSGITHAHPRSQLGCGIFICIAIQALMGHDPHDAYLFGITAAKRHYLHSSFLPQMPHYQRVLRGGLTELKADDIKSDGYVVHTLEAALWAWLTGYSYRDTVLRAVNLGDDTDTVGAIAGGLAGITWGLSQIPPDWLSVLARYDDIVALAERFSAALCLAV